MLLDVELLRRRLLRLDRRYGDVGAFVGITPGEARPAGLGIDSLGDLNRNTDAKARWHPASDRPESAGAEWPAVKRALDIALAILLLGALSPLALVVATLVRVTDGRPVIFWQRRVGQHGREFWFPKFRSMCDGAERLQARLLEHNDHSPGVTFKMREDPRVTPVGRLIRRLSLDELPQLWCVLRGDMSLVGPRPPLPSEVARYTATERRRLTVKPGLTCIWQVSGRSLIPFEEQVVMDIRYVEQQSLRLDLRLLVRTIPAVLSCRGAY